MNHFQDKHQIDELSECQHCFCSTKTTVTGQCGKCRGYKAKVVGETTQSSMNWIEKVLQEIYDEFAHTVDGNPVWDQQDEAGCVFEFVRTALQEAYDQGEEVGFSASKLLWDRMDKWNKEWQAEKPEERALTDADGLKLIEWKIEQAQQQERERIMNEMGKLTWGQYNPIGFIKNLTK